MMIRYARRKKKQDLFVLWLGLSTMTFGIAGATLKGVSAVKAVPVLIDSEPVAMPITIVAASPPAEAPTVAPVVPIGSEAIGSVKPLPLPGAVPDPVVLDETGEPELPPVGEP